MNTEQSEGGAHAHDSRWPRVGSRSSPSQGEGAKQVADDGSHAFKHGVGRCARPRRRRCAVGSLDFAAAATRCARRSDAGQGGVAPRAARGDHLHHDLAQRQGVQACCCWLPAGGRWAAARCATAARCTGGRPLCRLRRGARLVKGATECSAVCCAPRCCTLPQGGAAAELLPRLVLRAARDTKGGCGSLERRHRCRNDGRSGVLILIIEGHVTKQQYGRENS